MASVQKTKTGKFKVVWYVSKKRRRTKTFEKRRDALGFKAKIENEIAQSAYLDTKACTWDDFYERYKRDVLSLLAPGTQGTYKTHLNHFERICSPELMSEIDVPMIDKYKAKRAGERGEKRRSTASAATVNAELRTIKVALNKARSWKFIKEVPEIKPLREIEKLPRVMSEEQFISIYKACRVAEFPQVQHCSSEQWWKGLLTFIYCTGWRISEPLNVLRHDIDLDRGFAITRENKGKREEVVRLADVVIRDLHPLMGSFHEELFPWPHGKRGIYAQWHKIQDEAGIDLKCTETRDHECNIECRHFGFHDIRRTFATRTGANLSRDELKTVMRHKDSSTTDGYINMRERLKGVDMADKLNLPDALSDPSLLSDSEHRNLKTTPGSTPAAPRRRRQG